jgi:hypothetical protein
VLGVLNRGPAFPIGKGEAHVKALLVGTDRRYRDRSRVNFFIVGSSSLAWVQVLEDRGGYLEAVVEDTPLLSKDIRQLVTSATPSSTISQALDLEPRGPWDGCMFAHAPSPKDIALAGTLLKRWQPAIAILSLGASMARSEALCCLPSDLPAFYHKRMMTYHHTAIGGVTTTVRHFVHYTRWNCVQSCPSLMTSDVLPRMFQTALADTYGPSGGGSFKAREGMTLTESIGVLANSSGTTSVPVFSDDKLGPDLALLPFENIRFLVLAHSVFSKQLVLHQAWILEVMAVWDSKGKLEAQG